MFRMTNDESMSYLFGIIIFLFGSAIGSFLNVVICRLETGEGIVKKRSHCPKCGQVLAWYDLMPLVSFFMLRGKCRYCGKKISWQYPLVEIATGLLFVLVAVKLFPELVEGSKNLAFDFAPAALRSGNIPGFFYGLWVIGYWLYVVCSLIVIFVYDLRHYIIPDKVVFPAMIMSLVFRFLESLAKAFDFASLRSGNNLYPELIEGFKITAPYFLAAFAASAFFAALIVITRGRGMGWGDVKLAFLMGLILGWSNILIALFLAFWS